MSRTCGHLRNHHFGRANLSKIIGGLSDQPIVDALLLTPNSYAFPGVGSAMRRAGTAGNPSQTPWANEQPNCSDHWSSSCKGKPAVFRRSATFEPFRRVSAPLPLKCTPHATWTVESLALAKDRNLFVHGLWGHNTKKGKKRQLVAVSYFVKLEGSGGEVSEKILNGLTNNIVQLIKLIDDGIPRHLGVPLP